MPPPRRTGLSRWQPIGSHLLSNFNALEPVTDIDTSAPPLSSSDSEDSEDSNRGLSRRGDIRRTTFGAQARAGPQPPPAENSSVGSTRHSARLGNRRLSRPTAAEKRPASYFSDESELPQEDQRPEPFGEHHIDNPFHRNKKNKIASGYGKRHSKGNHC